MKSKQLTERKRLAGSLIDELRSAKLLNLHNSIQGAVCFSLKWGRFLCFF